MDQSHLFLMDQSCAHACSHVLAEERRCAATASTRWLCKTPANLCPSKGHDHDLFIFPVNTTQGPWTATKATPTATFEFAASVAAAAAAAAGASLSLCNMLVLVADLENSGEI